MPDCSLPSTATFADTTTLAKSGEAHDTRLRDGLTVSLATWPGGVGEEPVFEAA
ncbi:hypothetical protein [Azospirillum rugosum]|uniref:Uncharacterized protein n=1 Tax=Azospirillum rugosum TaxID=416170 RepID=A0ABS4SJY5_9PROT|nr:hypothetical protein [Azospirillum rugosum]MBP2292820.1 hypothetical protein [Azospirillum rugosum]MDQ0527079.1 hypothetical protein [Azospirillum rugosum]